MVEASVFPQVREVPRILPVPEILFVPSSPESSGDRAGRILREFLMKDIRLVTTLADLDEATAEVGRSIYHLAASENRARGVGIDRTHYSRPFSDVYPKEELLPDAYHTIRRNNSDNSRQAELTAGDTSIRIRHWDRAASRSGLQGTFVSIPTSRTLAESDRYETKAMNFDVNGIAILPHASPLQKDTQQQFLSILQNAIRPFVNSH